MPAPYWPIVGPTATLVAYSSITCWRFVGSPQHGDTHSFPPLHGDGPQSARHCMLSGRVFMASACSSYVGFPFIVCYPFILNVFICLQKIRSLCFLRPTWLRFSPHATASWSKTTWN